jgi:holin-like protein
MLKGTATILAFQLTGEAIAVAFHLPVSGPIIGMALLLMWMQRNGDVDKGLAIAADGLLANMAVLFVPIGVGAMAYAEVFRRHWLFVAVAVVLGTFATIATTALVARLLTRAHATAPAPQT